MKKSNILSGSSLFIAAIAVLALSLTACGGGGGGGPRGGGGGSDISEADCLSGAITTWGEAPIFTSIDGSRGKAKENACLKAIEKCIGEQVARVSGVSNGQSIANEIFSQTKGMCKNDRIVEEKQYKLDTITMLKVFVRFEVSESDVNSAINTAQKMAGNPKIMVLIHEEYKAPGANREYSFTDPDGQASSNLREYLITKGYQIIPSEKAAVPKNQQEALAESPDQEKPGFKELMDNALKAKADVVIIGKVEVNQQNISGLAGTDFKSTKATGTVRMITLWGRGKEIGTYAPSQGIGGAGTTYLAAAKEACKRFAVGGSKQWKTEPGGLALEVEEKLRTEWANVTQANQIIIKLSNMDSKMAGLFRDDLKEKTPVKEIHEQSTEGTNHEWEVIFPGREFALADTLNYHGDNPAMFEVVRRYCRKIVVESVKRGVIKLDFKEVPADTKFRCVPAEKL